MVPTLRPGDYLIGKRSAEIARHDVVAFEHPQRPGFWLVKRAIGLPTETIDLDESTIDGQPFDDPFREKLVESGQWMIGPGQIFVLSDNRTVGTIDSRVFGPVEVRACYLIRFRYWPLRSAGRIAGPSPFL